ncbi:MAG: ATP-dependent DNA helicase, partial [Zetaproteobacteria bacterium]
ARRRLGLDAPREAFHASPFDYEHQALIYIPKHLSDTRSPAGIMRLTDEMEALIRLARGRAFVLFTAWETLRQVAGELRERLPWNVLIQGESGSRDAILETFREDTHSVLCGTRSFWEGVDVPGESLSLVIIDRVPFAPPNDPLLAARLRRCEEQGGRPFTDIQLPEAIATLRQGVGRLIRNEHDRGVIALLDSRLHQRSYGREIVRNLPPARITPHFSDVEAFFAQ